MRKLLLVGAALLVAACSHPQNPERKDPLTDQVTGSLRPTDPAFNQGDPAASIACKADRDCPTSAMCQPDRHVCFTTYPDMQTTKLAGPSCPLVPLYFAFDSTELVPEAKQWVQHDADCLRARGVSRVHLDGYADERGDADYNRALSTKRAQAVKDALTDKGVTIDVVVRGAGATNPVLSGTSEHDFAYNRRVELNP